MPSPRLPSYRQFWPLLFAVWSVARLVRQAVKRQFAAVGLPYPRPIAAVPDQAAGLIRLALARQILQA